MKKRALISVYVKDGILELAGFLFAEGWEILSTGGTAKYLTENGISVTDVSSVTGFPECLDGRVKTLHPAIHAGLLAKRSDSSHTETLKKLDITPIDLVCVNLYPFFEKVQAGLSFDETVEFIDIGGPTMLRSAAKNFQDVIVLTDPADYPAVTEGLRSGTVSGEFRRKLAGKVFNLTSAYDAAVSRFMLDEDFPAYFSVPLKKGQALRYGENAHQNAALYLTADRTGAIGGMRQLQGKELSYNNIRDLDVAWKAASAYNRLNAAESGAEGGGYFTVALKHNTPCGAAVGATAADSYRKTYKCDPVSIYGGIIGCNGAIDGEAAREMAQTFLEVIVAPGFTEEALEVFSAKKNLRLMQAQVPAEEKLEFISIDGGVLVQQRDAIEAAGIGQDGNGIPGGGHQGWRVVTKKSPTREQIAEMAFGMTVAMFAKSNAIVVVKDRTAVGIGCGQTNRIWAAEQALERAKAVTAPERAVVLVSDAFFPFSDCVEKAAEYGIKAIVQPGGSIRDQESIDACDRLGISMIFTGVRHFKH
ncbi:MAG: bifunctional phosphoribosylaminoimidazolecarboxamide formyltransferase/IMP cyclohydrolase [Spirochaetaceae bacterium]|jgi:phosphoribosylaminoimidazolecarboxamide formyltransferase/IMP cyclohydrolase|nr:bifunctional phosphoribosylaminoimidazolecarboxamide formyltransferase/IMP cyclohydrolase [Spirochaetaceae bacterium]